MSETTSKKRKLSLPLIVAGGVSSLVLALGMSPTFSAFTASIQNTINTAGAGTLTMVETTGNGLGPNSCSSSAGVAGSADCTTINKYGNLTTMKPGDSTTTTIHIVNTGTINATSFSLAPGACSGSLCTHLKVTMIQDGVAVPLANGVFASALPATVPLNTPLKGVDTKIDITVLFVATGTDAGDNLLQGQSASQPLTWKFLS